MGGRGTFAAGNSVTYTYETVGFIDGIKVLHGLNGKHGLPEEAHSSIAYIKLKPDGTFHEIRIYNREHFAYLEIAYHPEPSVNNGNKRDNVLHYHFIDKNFNRSDAIRLHKGSALYKKFRKYFRGVK